MIVHAIKSARMSEIVRELTSQPDTWRRAAAEAPAVAATLPRSGDRVAAVGCGTSLFVVAGLRRAPGGGRGGRDRRVRRLGGPRRTYLRRGDGDLAERHDDRGGTAARAAVGRRPLGGDLRRRRHAGRQRGGRTRSSSASPTNARSSRRGSPPARSRCSGPDSARTWSRSPGTASGRSRPTCRSTSARSTTSCSWAGDGRSAWRTRPRSRCARRAARGPSRIRPWSTATAPSAWRAPRSAVWPLGDVEPDLLHDVAATGATIVDHGLGAIDPMAELILVQRTAVALAEARGLDPDRPRHLTRSVVLS